MINPEEIFLYDYTLLDGEDFIDVKLRVPPFFDVNSIKIEIKEDKKSIRIKSEERVSFVCGTMYGEIESHTESFENGLLTFHLIKKEKGLWPIFIVTNDTQTLEIDPKSAFILFNQFQKSPNKEGEDQQVIMQYLAYSARVGFIPSVRIYGKSLAMRSETLSEGIMMLTLGMQMYHDAECQYILAHVYSQIPSKKGKALELMEGAANAGMVDAMVACGEFYSPLSNLTYDKKDVNKAIEWFNKGLEHENNWVALYELAKLHFYGVGFPQDHKLGRELYKKAKIIHPTCPPLEVDENGNEINTEEAENKQPVTKKNLIILGLTSAVVLGFTGLVYKTIKKSK